MSCRTSQHAGFGPLRALAAAGLAIPLLSSCASWLAPAPEPDDWLAFGFREPEATVNSFLTALAADREDLEYLCLSAGLKRREGGSLLGYLLFRDELREAMPWLKAAARAEIERVEFPTPDRARVQARIDWLFWDETLIVDLVADGYFEYWSGAQRLEDGYVSFAPTPRGTAVFLALPAPEDADLADVTEVRAGLEWKIDALSAPPEDPPETP